MGDVAYHVQVTCLRRSTQFRQVIGPLVQEWLRHNLQHFLVHRSHGCRVVKRGQRGVLEVQFGHGTGSRWQAMQGAVRHVPQHLLQDRCLDGLGDVVIHASGKATFTIRLLRISGHGDHRDVGIPFGITNTPHRLQAVHLGHHHVHQHHVVLVLRQHVQRNQTIGRHSNPMSPTLEQGKCDLLIDQVVFNQQNA